MIALVGSQLDEQIVQVRQRLEESGTRILVLDQDHMLDWAASMSLKGTALTGWLTVGDQKVDVTRVTAVYNRLVDPRVVLASTRGKPERLKSACELYSLLGLWM